VSIGFPRKKLTDVVFFQEGPGLRKWQWTDTGMKVINVTNLLGNEAYTVDTTNTDKYISLVEFEAKYKHFEVNNGDLVVASSGNTYGKVGRITERNLPLMMNTSVIRFRSIEQSELDDRYLFCFLRSNDFRGQVDSFVTGGAQPNFGPTHLKKMDIPVPEISIQKKIGSIIVAYDDLIENNRRRIQLLEESARLLYKEWFVQLRFPGHEHVKIIDGVPEGWGKTTAYEVMDVLSGGTPKTKVAEYWDGEIPFFTPKDTTDNAFCYSTKKMITELGLSKCNSRLYAKNTLFITARGTVGKLSLAQREMAMNQSCYALVGQGEINQFFLYCSLKAAIDQFKARASGAVFDAIVVDTFKLIPFLKPTPLLIEQFTEFVTDVFDQVDKLSSMNRRLSEARDLLLPRLMNGTLTV